MADKIYNIGDYKKDETVSDDSSNLSSPKTVQHRTPYVRPDEMNPDDIQIEDPMNFLTSEEKQEYIKAHQEALLKSRTANEVRQEYSNSQGVQYRARRASNQGPYQEDPGYAYRNSYNDQPNGQNSQYQGSGYSNQLNGQYQGSGYGDQANGQYQGSGYSDQQGRNYDDGYGDDYYDEYNGPDDQGFAQDGYYNDQAGYQQGYSDEMYQDQADYEEYEEDMEGDNDKMAIITKVLAGVTALLIIVIAIMFVFNKVNDPAKEDEAGDEFAYTTDSSVSQETDSDSQTAEETVSGTTVYTTSGLNLRTSPEKTDSNKAMSVEAGTELTLVGEENGWAKVYYQGNYYYCSKSYLSETK
ncbi:MAG: SH3 domain-containing protein [Butyrivibrio sp.]|uniref:SH3 domain-containing protein n=1 Tax=Butyrivibrio sp. TaxID=28121 RepID=UPI0025E9480D|nr:SH3 domain-containing protein [Butyrivibrio sp.]MCR5770587.1 SH3 domain-containing protein [Butyrivibrio sp.]